MMAPEITSVDPVSGSAPDEIIISGNYFGTKKGKVYLEYEQSGKLKRRTARSSPGTWIASSSSYQRHPRASLQRNIH